ncbi:hypothetical protein [Noviherbaspirillum galbum]|uniref:Uncharacterized protein n=1 Tax=Noviherbaspirillum galbum TaxID=2709383 RepID=A0A6B3SGV7_9BURK|nr:hypothetical protein [Noviherbaspirillum galbum]NEX60081.1 hypothetical protein [Noviherbaspirillum galbum]
MHPQSGHDNLPYFLGQFAIYASSLYAAREVFDKIASDDTVGSYGTAKTVYGEQISWSLVGKKLPAAKL